MATRNSKKKKPTKSSTLSVNKKGQLKKKDIAESYNQYKEFEGQQYTGMQVGLSHKWNYDAGVWREKKVTPDLWEISYAVTKRRAGKAPEGSGVPVGTEYHWYILAHQNVKKLNANDYTTELSGLKYKLAHKRADKDKWNTTAKTQRKRLIKLLQEMISQLQKDPVPLQIEYGGKEYKGEAIPIMETCKDGVCFELDVTLNDEHRGIIHKMKNNWKMDEERDQKFVDAIGQEIMLWYE